MTPKKDSKLSHLWPLLIGATEILLICSLPVIGWAASSIVNHETRISVIERDRLTKDDGRALHDEITTVDRNAATAISQIHQAIAGMPSEVPPTWFVQRVDKIESRQDKISSKLEEISDALARLEGHRKLSGTPDGGE